jgi:galactokinase
MKSDVVRRVKRLFEGHFGTGVQAVGYAPGRVNLIGEHVDYCGGLVLPVALERITAVAVRACQEREGVEVISEAGPHEGGSNVYVEGVVALWRAWVVGQGDGGPQRGTGGLRVAIASDVTVGAGL